MVTDAELDAIVDATDRLESDAVSFLEEMVRTPSVNPPGEYGEIHDLVRSRYEEFGWETETVWTPEETLADLGLPEEYPRPNVLAYVSRGNGPTIALNAHLDTVPVDGSETWDHDPFGAEIDDGHLYGRGATDCKGRIASYTLAARVLERADLLPDATVVLAVTADEETGGEAGPGYLTESGTFRPDYAVVEGSVDSVWHAAAGVLHYRVTVSGKASHAGVNPEGGANALAGAARIVTELEEYGEGLTERKSSIAGVESATCTPATVEGGAKTNIVPASCSFTVDQRVPPDFDIDDLETEFRDVVASVELPEGTTSEVEVVLRALPHLSDPDDVQVKALAENAAAILGEEVPVTGVRGFTDARFFVAHGTKVVNFGPGDDDSNIHGADENVALDQVRDAGAIVAAGVLDIARNG